MLHNESVILDILDMLYIIKNNSNSLLIVDFHISHGSRELFDRFYTSHGVIHHTNINLFLIFIFNNFIYSINLF